VVNLTPPPPRYKPYTRLGDPRAGVEEMEKILVSTGTQNQIPQLQSSMPIAIPTVLSKLQPKEKNVK
jgi:hypothetical protein